MEIYLPYSIGSRDLPSLYSLCRKIAVCEESELVLNGERVQFIDPEGLAVLGALLSKMPERAIRMPWLPPNVTAYMDLMNFFNFIPIEDVNIPSKDKQNIDNHYKLTELTCIASHAECDNAANNLADSITGTFTTASPYARHDPNTGKNEFDRYRHPLWYSLSELIGNSLTHARQNGNLNAQVWVAAQYYDKPGIVKMAIVDNGCGMLETLRKHEELKEKSHYGAIVTSLIPKVSCNRDGTLYNTQGNQGVGLTTTSRIAKAAKGALTITSGDSYFHTTQRHLGGRLPHDGFWQGVAIGFHCRRTALPSVSIPNLLPPQEQIALDLDFED